MVKKEMVENKTIRTKVISENMFRKNMFNNNVFKKKKTKKNILIVDDDTLILSVFKDILGSEGYNIFTAKTTFEAEMLFIRNKIDLMISDVHIGEEFGFDLVNMISSIKPNLPIIVMTTDLGGEHRELTELLGHEFLPKPVSLQVLIDTVNKAIRFENNLTDTSSTYEYYQQMV